MECNQKSWHGHGCLRILSDLYFQSPDDPRQVENPGATGALVQILHQGKPKCLLKIPLAMMIGKQERSLLQMNAPGQRE